MTRDEAFHGHWQLINFLGTGRYSDNRYPDNRYSDSCY
jgi:hypothetical protein